jgi:hypothetical protein
MNERYAEFLVNLLYHRASTLIDVPTRGDQKLVQRLTSLNSSEFATPFEFSHSFGKDVPYQLITIKYVINNEAARHSRFAFGEPILSSLRRHHTLIRELQEAPHPYSLLGTVERYTADEPMTVMRRPLLISAIQHPIIPIVWEKKNTTYTRSTGILEKAISEKEYFTSRS